MTSVFLAGGPNMKGKGCEMSATSAVPEWMNSACDSKVLNDINNLVGGAKRGRKSGSKKKGSKRKGSKASKKLSRGASKKRHSKAGSKKRGSKSGSKRRVSKKLKRDTAEGAPKKRGAPQGLKPILDIKAAIKKEDSSINQGIPLTVVVHKVLKMHDGNVAKAIEKVKELIKSGELHKKVKVATEEMAAKRAAKKAAK